ncbi:hypothetical protein KFK09_007050 [Dendrobium nobile]|uniref:N-acyl-aliphatic-L-amino acid amidohydrolase n=1 Tax=Dendrobium nobile TaxID=94219 RepID=A0A8T3BT94_DENNO|nr:hypothetical protein KFK09_007050 [Dendrobium nobile]
MERTRALLLLLLCLLSPAVAVASVIYDNADSIIARFQEYLRINTAHPSPDYATSTRFILAQSASIGLEAETLEFAAGKPLVLLTWPGRLPSLPSLLLNSHTDVVSAEPHKWRYPPFSASTDSAGKIFARGSQDMKCVGLQYLEAIRGLKAKGFSPDRTIHVSFVPDEEIGGHDGAEAFAKSEKFRGLNVGVVFDEGLASPSEEYRVFYAERSPWWMVIKARGAPGHGARMYDGSAMENLAKSLEVIRRFRASQFDLVKSGRKAEGEVVSVNMVFFNAGTPSSTSRTGFVMNVQPSEAEAGFDIRVPPNADPQALERRIAEEWAPSSRNLTFEFLNKAEYLKGIAIYESIIKEFATYSELVEDEESRAEL